MDIKIEKKKPQKFSYSKMNCYESCGWKYYLNYVENHFIFSDSLSSELGTLVHFIEQSIFDSIKLGEIINYEKLKEDFYNINIPKKSKFDTDGGIFGINILKEKYKEEFYKADNDGKSYFSKTLDYINYGIYRLEKYLKDNPDLEPFEAEKAFSFEYRGYILSGFIDRIFHNKITDEYIIEDIKTKAKPFKDEELKTPLQLIIYIVGLNKTLDIPVEKISCAYDLPFLNIKQPAGTKGFVKRGITKINSIFDKIEAKDFTPNPTPLCHWCQFCPTNPEQPEEGKDLCPYYSLWTREFKTQEVANKWRGMEFHGLVLEEEKAKNERKTKNGADKFDFEF